VSSATFEALRTRHTADRDAALPGYTSQLEWPAERLRTERERRMRILLETAKARSPWHRERLRHVDATAFTEADLLSLPTMSKGDLMDNFEAVVTDPRLTRDVVDAYVERPPENLYLFDRYLVVASGGSSGRRGVFVYDWDAFIAYYGQIARWSVRNALPMLGPWANIAAPRGAHATWIAYAVFPPPVPMTHILPTLPLAEIVERLNALQPKRMSGYASTFGLLAEEARAGRLVIAPQFVGLCGEPLFPEVREAIESAWPVRVYDFYGTSEGLYALPCSAGDAMHLPDDLCYLEPVDEAGRPVPPGTPATKVLITNLYNTVEPLVRFEVTDELVMLPDPCPCGVASRRITHVLGRSDDVFAYPNGVHVHPIAIRGPLGHERNVVEYQALQTARGVRVRFLATGHVDERGLATNLEVALRRCGLVDPEVRLERVPELPRQVSGKLKRFVPREEATKG
jgi:phenylacetate-CoA ligase